MRKAGRCVYALKHPDSGVRFYIGQMLWPGPSRLRQHRHAARNSKMRADEREIILDILRSGQQPIFEVLAFSSDGREIIDIKRLLRAKRGHFVTKLESEPASDP